MKAWALVTSRGVMIHSSIRRNAHRAAVTEVSEICTHSDGAGACASVLPVWETPCWKKLADEGITVVEVDVEFCEKKPGVEECGETLDIREEVGVKVTCPLCSASHSRGPVNGTTSYRCLGCGHTWTEDPLGGIDLPTMTRAVQMLTEPPRHGRAQSVSGLGLGEMDQSTLEPIDRLSEVNGLLNKLDHRSDARAVLSELTGWVFDLAKEVRDARRPGEAETVEPHVRTVLGCSTCPCLTWEAADSVYVCLLNTAGTVPSRMGGQLPDGWAPKSCPLRSASGPIVLQLAADIPSAPLSEENA